MNPPPLDLPSRLMLFDPMSPAPPRCRGFAVLKWDGAAWTGTMHVPQYKWLGHDYRSGGSFH
jgi:hypothetical protein